jgi:hypothetical protein
MTDDLISTTWNLGTSGDDVYAALMAAHEGLSDADSARLNARLVLLLMNHIGDRAVIEAAIAAARNVGSKSMGSA